MADANKAVECLRQRFKSAMSAGRIQDVLKIDNCTVLAAVGEEMASRKGISAKVTRSDDTQRLYPQFPGIIS